MQRQTAPSTRLARFATTRDGPRRPPAQAARARAARARGVADMVPAGRAGARREKEEGSAPASGTHGRERARAGGALANLRALPTPICRASLRRGAVSEHADGRRAADLASAFRAPGPDGRVGRGGAEPLPSAARNAGARIGSRHGERRRRSGAARRLRGARGSRCSAPAPARPTRRPSGRPRARRRDPNGPASACWRRKRRERREAAKVKDEAERKSWVGGDVGGRAPVSGRIGRARAGVAATATLTAGGAPAPTRRRHGRLFPLGGRPRAGHSAHPCVCRGGRQAGA